MPLEKILDKSRLKPLLGDYRVGKAFDCLLDPEIMRRRQLGRMMIALDLETAKKRIPVGDYFISRKIDGEFTCLVYRGNKRTAEALTVNPGGTVRASAPFHREAAELLQAAGVKSALIGGELYVNRPDGKRPWVHDVVRVARKPEDQAAVDSLGFGIFNIYDLDGVDLSMRYAEAIEKARAIFGDEGRVHSVETVTGDELAIFKQYARWVDGEGAEGVVIRGDRAGVFKIKPRHTLDLAVVGFKVYFPDGGELNLLAVHLPLKKKQPPFLHALLELDPYHLEEDSLLIGDFNRGIPFEDSETKTFEHTHLFQQLLRQGWIDAWRARNPDKREYSWFSTRLKNGYCYDHALFSPRLNQRVENVYYDHGVREAGLSDHSLLKVEIGE